MIPRVSRCTSENPGPSQVEQKAQNSTNKDKERVDSSKATEIGTKKGKY